MSGKNKIVCKDSANNGATVEYTKKHYALLTEDRKKQLTIIEGAELAEAVTPEKPVMSDEEKALLRDQRSESLQSWGATLKGSSLVWGESGKVEIGTLHDYTEEDFEKMVDDARNAHADSQKSTDVETEDAGGDVNVGAGNKESGATTESDVETDDADGDGSGTGDGGIDGADLV